MLPDATQNFTLTVNQATQGLVAAYSFENAGTTVADASGNGNTGTIANATWTTAGKYGNALVFNGTNAWVTIPDSASLHLTTGMTLEAWVNPSTVSSAWRDVIYKGNDNYFSGGNIVRRRSVPAGGGTFGGARMASLRNGGFAAKHVDAPGDDLRRDDIAAVRERTSGIEHGATGSILTSTQPAADRRGQPLSAVFPGDDRRSPRLQRGPDDRADSGRHEHADRNPRSSPHSAGVI